PAAPRAHGFSLRDVRPHGGGEPANELEIVRLGPPPSRPPFDEAQQLERAAADMWKWGKSSDRWDAQSADKPENKLEFVIDRQTDGALRNQVYILGRFQLSDDEALIV